MPLIDSIQTTLQPVRLKYAIGEWVVGSWRPRLVVADPPRFGLDAWPDPPDALVASLPANAEGFFCRKVNADRFPVGVGAYGRLLRYVRYRDVLHYVDLSGSFDGYLGRFSPKSRQNLTRSVRRFQERHPEKEVCRVYRSPEEMAEFQAEAVAISRQTYQTRLLDAGLPADANFLAALVAAASRGEARGYLLRDGETAIAFAWCQKKGARLVYDIIGYLPEHAKLSPGTVLLYLILRDAFADEDLDMVDFGPGEAQYKAMFATHHQEFVDVYLFRPGLRNRFLVSAHRHMEASSSAMGDLLERLGLKKWLKGLMRALRK